MDEETIFVNKYPITDDITIHRDKETMTWFDYVLDFDIIKPMIKQMFIDIDEKMDDKANALRKLKNRYASSKINNFTCLDIGDKRYSNSTIIPENYYTWCREAYLNFHYDFKINDLEGEIRIHAVFDYIDEELTNETMTKNENFFDYGEISISVTNPEFYKYVSKIHELENVNVSFGFNLSEKVTNFDEFEKTIIKMLDEIEFNTKRENYEDKLNLLIEQYNDVIAKQKKFDDELCSCEDLENMNFYASLNDEEKEKIGEIIKQVKLDSFIRGKKLTSEEKKYLKNYK